MLLPFLSEYNKFNNAEAQMLDSFDHMSLNIFEITLFSMTIFP